MSAIPILRRFYEEDRTYEGCYRAPNMQMSLYHHKEEAFVYHAGTVFRSVIDFGDSDSALFSQEVELD